MGLYPRLNLNEYVASMGIPRGPDSKVYVVDTENGDDDAFGKSWDLPLKTLIEAESRCVAEQHDTVIFIARATADNPAAAIVWDKDYTHLVGVGSPLPGLGNRNRVVMAAALTPCITFSGNGCIVKNMQFGNEYATGAIGVAIITGIRCYFENVFFMVPFATTAASYSVKLSGGENTFKRCTFGTTTSLRLAATYGLWVHKGAGDNQRIKFVDCEFLSWAGGGAGDDHALVYVDVDIDNEGFSLQFENTLFWNLDGGHTLVQAIDDNCTAVHQILLRGQNNSFVGVDAVGDDLVDILYAEHPGTGTQSGLLMVAVNEA